MEEMRKGQLVRPFRMLVSVWALDPSATFFFPFQVLCNIKSNKKTNKKNLNKIFFFIKPSCKLITFYKHLNII